MKESAKGKCLYLSDTFTKSRIGVRSLDYGFRFGKTKKKLKAASSGPSLLLFAYALRVSCAAFGFVRYCGVQNSGSCF